MVEGRRAVAGLPRNETGPRPHEDGVPGLQLGALVAPTVLAVDHRLRDGRYDFAFPVESSQLPFLRLLGTSDKDRKYVLLESGHMPPFRDLIRESLDWLDKYLGPVKR